ncbi:SDR family NAD(P)-dependent oxidoreductase [Lysobacter sp. N42]|nr:SDR family NAD(P)-dependent oxidoreductase [Aliidiomarina sp. B3213]TCZ90331.1 SDR family NAD(P)-dependent oxidoreductase [Lysobacter sp. N42]
MKYLVYGAGGGIGQALVEELLKRHTDAEVYAVSAQKQPSGLNQDRVKWFLTPHSLEAMEERLGQWQTEGIMFDGVISTIGWLHDNDNMPERRIEHLNATQLSRYFEVNAIFPMMLLQALKPLLAKDSPAFFAQLSAKVGSIEDNHLGGWYGYRASKAALNMFLKTAAIEFKRTHKKLVISSIHPGTTDSELSKPFQERIPEGKLYTAEQTAERMLNVIEGLTPSQTGGFWFWDGSALPW